MAAAVIVSFAFFVSSASASTVSGTEGAQLTSVVADSAVPCVSPISCRTFVPQASIDWGDGDGGTATVSYVGCELSLPLNLGCVLGLWEVSGSHTYEQAGTYAGSTTVSLGSFVATIAFSASISDAPLSPIAAGANAEAGFTFSGVVGSFSDANPFAEPGDFSATVAWGDGSTSGGTVDAAPGGGFQITASHTYGQLGQYPLTISIDDRSGASTTLTGTGAVTDAPPIAGAASALTTTAGSPFSDVVGTFTDASPSASAADFTATIDWGDGSTSTGAVSAGPSGGFKVTGGHTYHHAGTDAATITVTDGGGSVSLSAAVTVDDAPLTGTPSTISAFQGVAFSGAVATFTDANPFAAVGDFTASIDWGDGTTEAATVTAVPSGGFEVDGTHTFTAVATRVLTVKVVDGGGASTTIGSAASTTIQSAAQVGSPPAPQTAVDLTPANPSGENGWYRNGVVVTLVPNGLGVPVLATRCMLDPAEPPPTFDAMPGPCAYSGSGAAIAGDGTHVVYAASANQTGEMEPPVSREFKIDQTPPVVTCQRPPTFVLGGSGEVVVATVSDLTSGPASTSIERAARLGSTGTKAITLTGFDNAGNSSTTTCRYRVLGQLASSVTWEFSPKRQFTLVTLLLAHNVPVGSTVKAFCQGRGCPFASRTLRAAQQSTACKGTHCTHRGGSPNQTVDLGSRLKLRRLDVGARLRISITKPAAFGSTWTFHFLSARAPADQKSCLLPGSFTKQYAGC